MRKAKFKWYGIDIDYEYKTYKNIGKDYGNAKTVNNGWILNLKRYFRRWRNKNQVKYRFLNTYCEWKKYVTEKILENELVKNPTYFENMLHWLYEKQRDAKLMLDAIKAILIPIYIALVAIIPESYKATEKAVLLKWDVFVWCIIITIISVKVLCNYSQRLDFINDLIEITKENQ